MYSCEFCEISKDTFFAEHLRMTVSELRKIRKFSLENFPKFYETQNVILCDRINCAVASSHISTRNLLMERILLQSLWCSSKKMHLRYSRFQEFKEIVRNRKNR